MNSAKKTPLLVPFEFQAEIEQMSKAELMDMVWDYAMLSSESADGNVDAAMAQFRRHRDTIRMWRE